MKRLGYVFFKYAFALLFFATAIGKLLDNRGFAEVIGTYQLGIPESMLLPLALSVSFFELFIAYRIIKEKGQVLNSVILILNHLGYTILAIVTLDRGIALDNCGCFGVFLQRPLTQQTVWEDAFLVALSIIFLMLTRARPKKLF